MTEITLSISGGVFALSLWWFFSVEYRAYRIDFARQRLFSVRDSLFDAARSGVLAFEDPAYGMARSTLNGMIRFMHEASLIRVVIMLLTKKFFDRDTVTQEYDQRFKGFLAELPKESKDKIDECITQAHFILLSHLVHTSIILFVLFVPLATVFRFLNLLNLVKQRLTGALQSPAWQALDAEAVFIDSEIQQGTFPAPTTPS